MRVSLTPEPAIRPFLVAVVALFVVSFCVGLVAPAPVSQPLVEVFRRFVAPVRTLPPVLLFLFIFSHNVVAGLAALAGGALLGIVPIVSVAGNGFFIGVLCRNASSVRGIGDILLRLLPHGIFELPAFFIAAAYGLWLAAAMFGPRSAESEPPGARWKHAFRKFATVVVPLLFIAATIETTLGLMLKGK